MDNKNSLLDLDNDLLLKEHHAPPAQGIRREGDSVDDFEHLGHDTSPLRETSEIVVNDLLGNFEDDTFRFKDSTKSGTNLLTEKPLDGFASSSSSASTIGPITSSSTVDIHELKSKPLERGDGFYPHDVISEVGKHESELFGSSDFKKATSSLLDAERELDFLKESSHKEQSSHFPSSEFKDPLVHDLPKSKIEEPNKIVESAPIIQPIEISHGSSKYQEDNDWLKKESQSHKEEPKPPKEVKNEPRNEPKPKAPSPVPEISKEKMPTKKVSVDLSDKLDVTGAELLFCKLGLDAWFNPERLNPKVESLIYWRDPKKSGPVFGGVLVVLLALTYFSLISVVAYLSLLTLTGTISFRIYKNIVQAVQKTGDGHPFKDLLEFELTLSSDQVKNISELAVAHINAGLSELRRLFLVEDLVDSIKFGVLLWTLTYVGAWFNGMTLVILAWVSLFTLPKVYETNKTQIDANLEIVRTKLAEITSKVKAAIPIGKKEEKKEQ